MMYISFLDKINDEKVYHIHFKYFLHRGEWMYLFGNQHFTYGGMLPVHEIREFSNLLEFPILYGQQSECIRSFYGHTLRIILQQIGKYIDRYGT